MGSLIQDGNSWSRVVRLAEFPGERPTMREACLLDEQDTREGPATDAHLTGFSEYLMRVVNSVYKTLRAGSVIRERGRVTACFYFGDAPSMSDAEVMAMRIPVNVRHYQGNMLMVVRRDEARWWTREMGVMMADAVFADLVKQGY